MKKYLLTIFGDFKNNECEEIARSMEPLIDSTHLKFQYRNGVILFHFASEILMSDIYEFLELNAYEMYDSFILSEYNDKVSVFMVDDMKEHLFDLENESKSEITIELTPNNRFENIYDDEEEDDIVTLLLNEVKKNLKLPSMDELLDKINEHGVESLTSYEKATLDNYSK